MNQPRPLEYASPDVQPENSAATWSMICGIASFMLAGPLLALPAIILGHAARRQIKASGASGGGKALTGLICGYANLIIVAMLAALLVATHTRRATQSKQVMCAASLRLLGQMMFLYTSENRGVSPPSIEAASGAAGAGPSRCPFDTQSPATSSSYEMLLPPTRMMDIRNPHRVPVARDKQLHPTGVRCVLFADGHVEFLSDPAFKALPPVQLRKR